MSTTTPGLMNIGEEAKPPATVLPDPVQVFRNRAIRLERLAKDHALASYLQLVAKMCRAQADIQADLPAVVMPPEVQSIMASGVSADDSAPRVLHFDRVTLDGIAEQTLQRLAEVLAQIDAPEAFRDATGTILALAPALRLNLLADTLAHRDDTDGLAVRTIAAAALQVHFARLAAALNVETIAPVAGGKCPVCASAPTASAVVSWPSANNTRFCTCSLCATQWQEMAAYYS